MLSVEYETSPGVPTTTDYADPRTDGQNQMIGWQDDGEDDDEDGGAGDEEEKNEEEGEDKRQK